MEPALFCVPGKEQSSPVLFEGSGDTGQHSPSHKTDCKHLNSLNSLHIHSLDSTRSDRWHISGFLRTNTERLAEGKRAGRAEKVGQGGGQLQHTIGPFFFSNYLHCQIASFKSDRYRTREATCSIDGPANQQHPEAS